MGYYPESRVEVTGKEARLYDMGLNVITFGTYPFFIKKVIKQMNIKPNDLILDMGSGTGRNICIMRRYLSKDGYIMGLDIGKEMLFISRKRCKNFKNVKVLERRIDIPLNLNMKFDKVFISFVIHGFPQEVREVILDNAFKVLKENGEFFILDYNEFDIDRLFPPMRFVFKKIECPYAFDFIKRDFKEVLRRHGFDKIEEYFYYRGLIRLIKSRKRR